jgi:hypothetical protein
MTKPMAWIEKLDKVYFVNYGFIIVAMSGWV